MRGSEAAMVEHEPGALSSRAGLDRADEQNVIARPVSCMVAALEPRDATCDQRRARGAQPIRDVGKAIGVRPGKATREIHLIVREHVDYVTLRGLECGEATGMAIEAPQDERWVERHRVERVRREADEPTIRPARTDHRDTGRELRERIAKLPVRECGGEAGVVAVGGLGQCATANKVSMVAS